MTKKVAEDKKHLVPPAEKKEKKVKGKTKRRLRKGMLAVFHSGVEYSLERGGPSGDELFDYLKIVITESTLKETIFGEYPEIAPGTVIRARIKSIKLGRPRLQEK